jgi:hypothetical protein
MNIPIPLVFFYFMLTHFIGFLSALFRPKIDGKCAKFRRNAASQRT